jgi:hypothetical protein
MEKVARARRQAQARIVHTQAQIAVGQAREKDKH